MDPRATIAGYAYGARDLSGSPVSPSDLRELELAVGFDHEDTAALRELWTVIGDRREELFAAFMERVAHFFLPTFAGADGRPLDDYLAAAHPRFLQWIEDTCTRPYDREWLDYQHEIALRHHRTKKNRTDRAASAVDEVPLRFLVVALYPLTAAMEPFLVEAGVDDATARRLGAAWTKSLVLQVALWSRAYMDEGW